MASVLPEPAGVALWDAWDYFWRHRAQTRGTVSERLNAGK
jgi:hypothetical protein